MKKNFYFKNIYLLVVIVGAINWGLSVLDINVVDYLSKTLNQIIGIDFQFDTIIYLFIAISGIKLLSRNNFLPFLGKTVVPTSLVPIKNNKFNKEKVVVKVKPNSKVMYWAAKKMKDEKQIVWKAYDDYENSGVTIADKNGNATLILEKGSGYIVPGGKYIKPHVHYRYELSPGMFSEIKTHYYKSTVAMNNLKAACKLVQN